MKVAMMATGLTSYLNACFCALVDRGVELLVITRQSRDHVAYESFPIVDRAKIHAWDIEPSGAELNHVVDEFGPDAILAHSWHVRPYRDVLRGRGGQCVRVLWMDNNWLGTPKQWAGRLTSRWYLRPLYDAALIPCERSENFARRLGFRPEDVLRGSLSADTALFGAGPWPGSELADRRRFVSALRMVHHKGADVLADAYRRYRAAANDPWDLDLVGLGPLLSSFDGVPGVTEHGFLQPAEVAALFHRSSAYVNPSRAEPYGVVLHEATSAGLPVITSDGVGAAPSLVQDGYNGWQVAAGDVRALARAMARVSALSPDRLGEMSTASAHIAQRLSPSGWARNLEEFLAARL